MGDMTVYYYGNYNPIGDILAAATCIVFFVLMHNSYIVRTDTYSLFRRIIFTIFLASAFSLVFHLTLKHVDQVPHIIVYVTLILYHVCLYAALIMYILYGRLQLRLGRDTGKRVVIPAMVVFGLAVLYECLAPFFGWGLRIGEKNLISYGFNIFPVVYTFLCLTIIYILVVYRKRIYRQIVYSVMFCSLVSFGVLYAQTRTDESSFTVFSFIFPAFAILYMIHSNPYDLEIGAVDTFAFEKLIEFVRKRDKEYLLMELYLPDLDVEGAVYPEQVKEAVRRFSGEYLKGGTLFQIGGGTLMLSADIARNGNYEQIVNRMLNHFEAEYPKYNLDYKIVISKTMTRLGTDKDYVNLFTYAKSKMEVNTVHFIDDKDVDEYQKHRYILNELTDICKKKDLNDPRVEVFCQPVLNIETKKYDTAEALMRINLQETGRVFPDTFIPMAEQHGLIHQLSLIILHKTCEQIRSMTEEGYHIQRISVNISAIELREEGFCKDVSEVIRQSGIPFGKVAIELTESQSESDFMIMKQKIEELKENGIKFYLDDFGTGYSNFERIMELPFDIIKFDRSMVIASSTDEKSEQMVAHLAKMFSDMNYSVLYEGVETPADEENCVRMNAKYLQGYKYSRPIPMERLTDYFEKEVS